MKKIIFIGGLGSASVFGGEPSKNKELLKSFRNQGFSVSVADTYHSRKQPWKLLAIPFLLLRYPGANVVISTSLGNIYWLIRYFFRIGSKRKIVYWGIGGMFPSQVESGVFDRKVLSVLDTIVVEGEAMRQTLLRCGLTRVVVVPNFKTIPAILSRKKMPTNKDLIRFVFLSRIQPEKGVGYILDAVEVLNQEPECQGRFVVDFYGGVDSGYAPVFQERVSMLENVAYRGKLNLSSAEGYECLSSYHVMLFPTYWPGEGFPGVVIDAYIAGLPIIASDWSLNREFIENDVTGLIVPVHDIHALAGAMRTFIMREQNLETMALASFRKSLEFSVSNVLTPRVLSILN